MKKTSKAVLALGSNLGNRRENLLRAVVGIEKFSFVRARSFIYETPPAGYEDQGDFLNAAVFIETEETPTELLAHCKDLEKELGRMERFRNGPREIDVDIIFYGNEQVKNEALEIPHPRWAERDFVVSPLLDLLDGGLFDDEIFGEVKRMLSDRPKMFPPFGAF